MRISDWSSDVCSSDLMFEDAGVGAEGDRDAECLGARYRLADVAERHAHLVLDRRGVDALAEPLANPLERHERGDEIGALGFHHLERRVIGEGAMFDAVDARRGRGGDAARAVGVRHDLEAERMGGVGDALEFGAGEMRSEEHTSELQSLMSISYAVF